MASKHIRNRAAASRRRAPATPSTSPLPVEPATPPPYTPPVRTPAPGEPVWLEEDDPDPAPFDLATFDPNEFEWRPVARRRRSDGWTPDVQVRFIEALAETGLVSAAAEIVDMSVTSCYRLRRAPGGEHFARAWRTALVQAAERLVDLAFARAIEGVEEPVFHQGRRIGARTRFDERMAKFIMRAYLPDRFRHAHEGMIRPNEAPPAPELPFADALAALMPPVPPDPHLTLAPDALADLVEHERVMAEIHERYPRDERERYVRPRVGDRVDSGGDAGAPEPYDPADWRNFRDPPPGKGGCDG